MYHSCSSENKLDFMNDKFSSIEPYGELPEDRRSNILQPSFAGSQDSPAGKLCISNVCVCVSVCVCVCVCVC